MMLLTAMIILALISFVLVIAETAVDLFKE